MTETIPAFAAARRGAGAARHTAAATRCARARASAPREDVAAAGRRSSPPTPPRHVTGQCIGIGGDRLSLWSHPQEIAVAYADGGWSAEAIAAAWPVTVGRTPETFGIPAPRIWRTMDRHRTSTNWSPSTCTPTPRSPRPAPARCPRNCDAAADDVLQGRCRAPQAHAREIAAYYRERKMAAVVFTVDAEAATGTPGRAQRGDRRGGAAANPTCSSRSPPSTRRKGRAGAGRRGGSSQSTASAASSSTPACRPSTRTTGCAYALYEAIEATGAIARVPHRPDRHRRRAPRAAAASG